MKKINKKIIVQHVQKVQGDLMRKLALNDEILLKIRETGTLYRK
mgnify:CR=1 FL=1